MNSVTKKWQERANERLMLMQKLSAQHAEIAKLKAQLENDHKVFNRILHVFGNASRFTKDFYAIRTIRKLMALREAAK